MEKAAKTDWFHSLTEHFMPYVDTGVPTDIPNLNTTARYTQFTQLKLHDANQALNQLADCLHLDCELTV